MKNNEFRKIIKRVMEETLDYCQVACPHEHWKALRSKLLRIYNDALRELDGEEES